MDDVLTDLSAPALIRAIKSNLLEFFCYLHRSAQTDSYADRLLIRWRTRLYHPWFNGVLALQLPSDEYRQHIEHAITYFKSHGVSTFTWWLDPDLPIADWQRYLLPYGFRYDHNTPGMAVDLQMLREDTGAPSTLKIVPVENQADLKTWAHVFINGYELPAAWEEAFLDLMTGIGLDQPVRNYLGYLDGEPVATSNLFLAAGVAGIQCVATLPKARGRGIGAALTLAPLLEARVMGYRAGILQSSDMGFKVYQRLGFQKLCDVDNFYWTSESRSM